MERLRHRGVDDLVGHPAAIPPDGFYGNDLAST